MIGVGRSPTAYRGGRNTPHPDPNVGLDPAIVADKLGHADPAFTIKRYIGIRGDADATATRLTDAW